MKTKKALTNSEREINELVKQHWAYIEKLLTAHKESESTIELIKFHYKTAFKHGWKHCEDYIWDLHNG